ncbi:PREDICTED: uncharacterized protein LOC104804745 isoform X1 [Tarenaya hassleriana]|uniref:uncharacterized protein LOC104804745 isoform X1 n=1 Tax=Tarenaya hassleriana TaxID=28532 RepID=UPI00053C5086|nr:PREDICTED: uncharacterized protein LOC104804745 isoform X1 [Tarenaya hassleriana]
MVAEAWIVKMGYQVSANLKHALLLEPSTKKNSKSSVTKRTIGILSFEVANVMSKTLHLHRSLSESEISKLKGEIFRSEGIRNLVSSDGNRLFELARAEKLDDLDSVASVVSRLGKKCTEPALQGFEHVYDDIVNGVIDVRRLGFLVKDMESMVRKMERYINATSGLYREMEVMNELEQATKKFRHSQSQESRKAFEQKLIWQRQDVRHFHEISLWNQTYDKVVEMLARTVCTILARIFVVFGNSSTTAGAGFVKEGCFPSKVIALEQIDRSCDVGFVSGALKRVHSNGVKSDPVKRTASSFKHKIDPQRGELDQFSRAGDFNFPCGTNPGRLFMDCLTLSSSVSRIDDNDDDDDHDRDQSSGLKKDLSDDSYFSQIHITASQTCRTSKSGRKSRLMLQAPPCSIGGSALSLHYANVIIIIEKLLEYPRLVGEEARDDLYQMLPTSLRASLKKNLKSHFKNVSIYDAHLAHDWKETLDGILGRISPLAHNMIRWQSERNFEQQEQQIVEKRSNVLLIQTLYFADRDKTEAEICKLLVGLNYICHYEQQQNALLDCTSSFDLHGEF